MGVPSQTLIHNISDLLAAYMQKDLDGYGDTLEAKTVSPLWDYIDGSGDPEVEADIGTGANGVDTMNLPENLKDALATVCGRAPFQTFLTALINNATTRGGYAGLDALLTAKSALVPPLVAELHKQARGTDLSAANVYAPSYAVRAADAVYTGADGALVDDTTDANDADAADVALFASDDHYLYVGSKHKFMQVIIGLSTLASATIDPAITYWNGSSWATLTATDNSTGLTLNQSITFTAPSDWTRAYKDGGGTAFANQARLYYVRIQRQADALVTPPVATCIRLVPAATLNSASVHLGVDQPPLGIVRITANNTIVAVSVADVAHARWLPPAIRLRALNALGADAVITVSYTDQDGNNATQAQTNWVSPAALDTKSITLAGGDTGVRTVRATGWVVTSTGRGVIAVESVPLRTPAI